MFPFGHLSPCMCLLLPSSADARSTNLPLQALKPWSRVHGGCKCVFFRHLFRVPIVISLCYVLSMLAGSLQVANSSWWNGRNAWHRSISRNSCIWPSILIVYPFEYLVAKPTPQAPLCQVLAAFDLGNWLEDCLAAFAGWAVWLALGWMFWDWCHAQTPPKEGSSWCWVSKQHFQVSLQIKAEICCL